MKKLNPLFFSILSLILLGGVLSSCRDTVYKTFDVNEPIVISKTQWRSLEYKIESSRVLEKPGKIYLKDNLLYVNELGKGIHIYNNSNPRSPVNLGFLSIHYNFDIAIRGNILYASSYTDLLSFDISNPAMPVYSSRVEDVFSISNYYLIDGYNENARVLNKEYDEDVILKWNTVEVTEEQEYFGNYSYANQDVFMEANFDVMTTTNSNSTNSSVGSGVGGSMASFSIVNGFLYVLNNTQLKVYDISNSTTIMEVQSVDLWRTAETLYPYEDKMFVGTTSGMLIYQIAGNGTLNELSTFDHWTGCDPVVVEGDRAYVTLSGGCNSNFNVLEVVDISNIASPELIKRYSFTHLLGLGIENGTLFLCDDLEGLKVFDASDDYNIDKNMISHFPSMNAYDVIVFNGLLIMVGDDGVIQYDYSDIQNIEELSKILAN